MLCQDSKVTPRFLHAWRSSGLLNCTRRDAGTSPAFALYVMRWVVCCLVVLTWLVAAQTALAGDEKQPKHADKKPQTQAPQPTKPVPTLVPKPPSTPARAATATSKAATKPTAAPQPDK